MARAKKHTVRLPDRIVVGVDEKGLADHAVRRGIELGRRMGARVDLVHAVVPLVEPWSEIHPLRSSEFVPGRLARASEAIHARLRPILGRSSASSSSAGKRRHAVRVVHGTPVEVVLDAAGGKPPAWIVLGRHGARGWLEFGSTLRAIFAKSTVPVWVQARPVGPIRKILVPVDLSRESLSALATACALAGIFRARVRALHCFHLNPLAIAGIGGSALSDASREFARARRIEQTAFVRAMARFRWGGIPHTADFVGGEPGAKILAASRGADLVVLGSHGRTGLASVLLGGTAYGVLKGCSKPVLVIRVPGRRFRLR